MRDRSHWQRHVVAQMAAAWPADAPLDPSTASQVELGLFLLDAVCPEEPIACLWALLTGYPVFPGPRVDGEQGVAGRRMIGIARTLIGRFRDRTLWRRCLARYASLPEQTRGYDIGAGFETAVARAVSVAATRWEVYADALAAPLPHQRTRPERAGPGTFTFEAGPGGRLASVHIPADLPLPPLPRGHDLAGVAERVACRACWADLLTTATWMDEQLAADGRPPADARHADRWRDRLARVRLDLVNPATGAFAPIDTLTVDGILHLAGMVSSGKSTLMDILAVWAARRGLRVTLVVGDVVGAMRRVELFRALGLPAAPILGGSNRERHLERLHRVLGTSDGTSPLAALAGSAAVPAFDFLSTACGLDALSSAATPIPLGAEPCRGLHAEGDPDRAASARSRALTCPLYGGCQQHRAARELVDARIWVATPWSLVYSQVPPEINPERLRYAELVYRCSDLVVVDEADLVQVQLDQMFSPAQALVGHGTESWLDTLLARAAAALTAAGRGQLASGPVRAWIACGDAARAATNQLFALLQDPRLRRWIEHDYFTGWTLLDRLASEWTGGKGEDPAYERLLALCSPFVDDPLGARSGSGPHPLAALAREAVLGADPEDLHAGLLAWIAAQEGIVLPEHERADAAQRLAFAILLSVLSDRLDRLIRDWRVVEGPLGLEGSSPLLFHQPPPDFDTVIPQAPMGSVLGFQYLHTAGDPEGRMGQLRFFRCAGVGRWLLLHLHELFAADGLAGPNVLLLSGTSWAGTSPSYHLQVPVGGILHAPADEVAAIARSTFVFRPLSEGEGMPLRISGAGAGQRIDRLRALAGELARRSATAVGFSGTGTSMLERERDSLEPGRQRVLLLVGSYVEARAVRDHLIRLRPEWDGQVLALIPDDATFESAWEGAGGLRRGDVARFSATGAWLLVAPMLALERGHNILDEEGRQAAIGAAYVLVRPHPRPDDIGWAVCSINRWAVEEAPRLADAGAGATLDERGERFRRAAYGRWRGLLRLPLTYSTLPDREREALVWNALVGLWQVIGRLVRGGCPARVYFCDAAFAGRSAGRDGPGDVASSSLLVGMRGVLRPYFADDSRGDAPSPGDREIVRALYGPLWAALCSMQGVSDASI